MRSRVGGMWAAALVAAAMTAAPAGAVPLLGAETPRGTGTTTALPAVAPGPKTIDGAIGDWTGSGTGFGGTVVRSRGELVYTDHLFDAYGADDGRDAERLARMEPLENVPETYRLNALLEVDPAGEFGAPAPEQLRYSTNYGDLERVDTADLSELRLAAAPGGGLDLLARTTTMTSAAETALLVLIDTGGPERERGLPFSTSLYTKRADLAVLLNAAGGRVMDLHTRAVGELPAGSVAFEPDGWTNAIEARLPLQLPPKVAVAAAAGRPNASGTGFANVANVAFRTAEPVREWFDREQALALHSKKIDGFFADVDLGALAGGANERFTPGPGYHDAIFRSTEPISRERSADGILQHYGLYLPGAYDPAKATPLQLWLHWRGGTAHTAGHVAPGIFRDLGDAHDTLVVAPRGRGSSTWYVGKGQVDLEQVWADAHERVRIDVARRYVAGHSMGGYGSFLMSTLHPDWFAAGLPASPPVTQGAWTGVDFEGCDEFESDDYSPCYIAANGSDPRAQNTRKLLENLRHTPLAIYHGVADELVPVTGVTRQVERLLQLGYRHRYYLFPTQEHYGPPVWDEWTEAAAYMHRFTIPAAPGRVTYVRDMPFERATERVSSDGIPLDFSFDHAWWMSGLEPVDAENGQAYFDGRSLAIPEPATLALPEVSVPTSAGQVGPFVMTGLQWVQNPIGTLPAATNRFEATLRGARAVTLDVKRMKLDSARLMTGTVTTEAPLRLTLAGAWASTPVVTVGGAPVAVTRSGGTIAFEVPAGARELSISPAPLLSKALGR